MDINNRIVTTYMARAGNALSVLGQVEAGMLRGGRAAGYQARQIGLMEQQMRAFGTTVRYALAGTAVFGVTSLIGKLNQLQQQLGLISAIAPTAGVDFSQKGSLGDFLNQVERAAVDARTPVSELNNSVINFLSTVQNAPKDEIVDIVSRIGITAKLSQTPTEDLTKAVTTLNIAAGRTNNLKTTNALLREWFHLISTVPGGIAAAPQIAQQLGPLAAVSLRQGRMTPEQMFTIATGSLRFGATPSTALRGSQYFLQSLFQPQSKQARQALSAAGFTPQRLQQEGGARFVIDYLNYVKGLGANMNRRQITAFGNRVDLDPDTEAALQPNENIPGITPQAQQFLKNSIGRIHGIRTALTLLSQLDRTGQVSSLTDLAKVFDKLNHNVGKDANELNAAIDRFRNQTPLMAAAIALDTLRTQAETAFAPILNPVGRSIGRLGEAAARHPDTTRHVIQGAAIGAAALGMMRLLGGGRILGGGGIRGLFSRGGQGIITAKAIEDLSKGGVGRGESPANPIYVTVVGQLFGGGRGATTPTDPIITGGGTAAEASTLGKIVRTGAKYGVVTAAAYFGSQAFVEGMGLLGRHPREPEPRTFPKGAVGIGHGQFYDPASKTFWTQRRPGERFGHRVSPMEALAHSDLSSQQRKQFSPLLQKIAHDQVNNANSTIAGIFQSINKSIAQPKAAKVEGGVDLKITILDPFSNKQKDARVHIPLSTVHDSGRVPVSRGKRKSMRVDFTVGGTDIRAGGKP